MNWTNEMNFNGRTLATATMNVPQWANAECMTMSSPICELVRLEEKASKGGHAFHVPTGASFFSFRAGLANMLTKLADFVRPTAYASRA